MRHGARICLILCLALLLWAVDHSRSSAAEGFHPDGFDARRIETDKRALEERKSEEKREDSEAWFKKSVGGKDLTREPKAEFHDADQLLKNSSEKTIDNKNEAKRETHSDPEADQLLRKIESQEKKPDTRAADTYKNDPAQLNGRDPKEVESELDKRLVEDAGWKKSAMRDNNGVRYIDGKGGSIELNKGYSEGLKEKSLEDNVHQGPYAKISGGSIDRVPLKGNPSASKK